MIRIFFRLALLGVVVPLALALTATANDAQAILDRVRAKNSKVSSFEARVRVTIDVEFLKVPPSEATFTYDAKSGVQVKSDGFAMLPKQGIVLPNQMLESGNYTALFAGREKMDGADVAVVKVIPDLDTGEVVMSTLYIDEAQSLVRRIKLTTRKGVISMDMKYGQKYANVGLPSETIISFDLPAVSLPRSLTGDLHSEERPKRRPMDKPAKGRAVISYLDYKIKNR